MAKKSSKKQALEESKVILQTSLSYRDESKHSKTGRMERNKDNWDSFHLRGDFSHKLPGQSREFLPKQSLATEQFAASIQQGLVDMTDWFDVDPKPALEPIRKIMPVRPEEIKKILNNQLEKAGFFETVNDFMKLACNESLVIAKVHGVMVEKPTYRAKNVFVAGESKPRSVLEKVKNLVWEMRVDPVRGEDYYPDPSGRGLYEMEEIEMDTWELRELAQGPNALYDAEAVEKAIDNFKATGADEQDERKAREMDQNMPADSIRKKIRIFECWGSIIDPVTGDLLHKNVMWTCANDFGNLIQKPTRNPWWHGQSPYVVTPILRVPKSVWHKALNDAPTQLNHAMNEMFNLMVDGGMKAVHGISQIRRDWLADENQVSNGIPAGTTLDITSAAPQGAKVYEELTTGQVPNEGFNMYEILSSEFSQSVLSNELRQGQLPGRNVKATEVVEASQSLNSLHTAVAKNIEKVFISKILQKGIAAGAQNLSIMDDMELAAELGLERAQAIAALSRPELFAAVIDGFKFKVSGISTILARMKTNQTLMLLLQTIGQSDVLVQEFAKKYSFGRFLDLMLESLSIDPSDLELNEEEQQQQQQAPSPLEEVAAAQGQGGENDLNNVPEAGGTMGDIFPRSEFAPQPAETLPVEGQQS